jgi:MreB/Mrl family cell shape determining protein
MEGRDTAIDLGTSTTTVFLPGRGVVLEEPSLVALTTDDGRPVAVGSEARRMLGRTPASIEVVRPVQQGVIADLDVCTRMLRFMILQVHPRRWSRPKMLLAVPSGLSPVEQRAVQEVAEEAGGRRPAQLVEAHVAAALGVGLPIHDARGSMVVVVGGGRTEVAVLSLGGVVARRSLRLGGMDFDQAIIDWVKKEHGLALGERTAEELKIQLGSAGPARPEAARVTRDVGPDGRGGGRRCERGHRRHASGTGGRHHGARRGPDRRGCAAAGPRSAPGRRDRPADHDQREPAPRRGPGCRALPDPSRRLPQRPGRHEPVVTGVGRS